jgi:uncharacterized coiled-coil DUF342 family protein
MTDTISISRKEYQDMLEYMERMRETTEVFSNEKTVRKLNDALERVERGEFLTKEEMKFDDL